MIESLREDLAALAEVGVISKVTRLRAQASGFSPRSSEFPALALSSALNVYHDQNSPTTH